MPQVRFPHRMVLSMWNGRKVVPDLKSRSDIQLKWNVSKLNGEKILFASGILHKSDISKQRTKEINENEENFIFCCRIRFYSICRCCGTVMHPVCQGLHYG